MAGVQFDLKQIFEVLGILAALASWYILQEATQVAESEVATHNEQSHSHPMIHEKLGDAKVQRVKIDAELQEIRQTVNHNKEVSELIQRQNEQQHSEILTLLKEIRERQD